jgi:hypothetical protein
MRQLRRMSLEDPVSPQRLCASRFAAGRREGTASTPVARTAAPDPPERRTGVLHPDTPALLKLFVHENESAAIEHELVLWPTLATSIVTQVDLPRAVARAREEPPRLTVASSLSLQGVLASVAVIGLPDDIVSAAQSIAPVAVGAVDAIHTASALSISPGLAGVATYDKRMAAALHDIEIRVLSPNE